MEFFNAGEGFIGKRPVKELPSESKRELRAISDLREENVEEKNLKTIGIKESTKRNLSERVYGKVYFYETEDGRAGVFKEKESEYKKERAAYLVDKFLQFDLVPTTIIRKIGDKTGSFQRYVTDAKTGLEVSRELIPKEELLKLALFDFLINNLDRDRDPNRTNFFIKENHIFAVDNADSFSSIYADYSREYSKKKLFSAPIPEEIKNKIVQFDKWPEGKKLLSKSLEELLDKEPVDAFFKRLEYLVQYAKRGYFQTEEESKKFQEDNKLLAKLSTF